MSTPTTTSTPVTASAIAAELDTAARNLVAYATALRAAIALPAAADTASRRVGAIRGMLSGINDHVLPRLADAESWGLQRLETLDATLGGQLAPVAVKAAPVAATAPVATPKPAPVAAVVAAVLTLSQYESAMRAAFPAIPADATFDASYAGFLASGLPVAGWVSLSRDDRAVWVSKAAPKVELKPGFATLRAMEPAPQMAAAKPAPKADAAPRATKGDGLARYRKLQARCKRAGLSGKGTKAELTARLAAHTASKPAAPKAMPAAARETSAPKTTTTAGLPNGTHQALAVRLGVNVGDLADALAGLGLKLVTV